MAKDQPFTNFEKVNAYYPHAYAVDDFDLDIKQVKDDKKQQHARVELVFLQDKGSASKTDVVAAIRMSSRQLEQLHELIGQRLKAFRQAD